MATVVISPVNVAQFPDWGEHFWVYMHYVQGLRHLGCEVYWLERFNSSGDRHRDALARAMFFERMERYGLGGKLILYGSQGQAGARNSPSSHEYEYIGVSRSAAETVWRNADLLLNFNYRIDPGLLSCFRRTAFVDIEPGLPQFWTGHGPCIMPPHDLYFTTGEAVGRPGTLLPDSSLPWIHIRPPVCLQLWPYVHDPRCEAFTTVSSGWGDEWMTDGTDDYENDKRVSFLEFADLPRRTSQTLELALLFEKGDARGVKTLRSSGWRVRHSHDVARSPETYRAYIQRSRGEFNCARPSCMKFQNAQISERTLCYLASGKPAVVQNTELSSFLPNGEGLFRFSTMQEAVAAISAINADYERHCRAARAVAEAYFDAEQVVADMLNAALHHGSNHSRQVAAAAVAAAEA